MVFDRKSKAKKAKMAGSFLIALVLVVVGALAHAQPQRKVPRLGFLSADSQSASSIRTEAFRQGLRELGYVEGQNIVIDYRFGEGKRERFPDLAAELAGLKVNIIVSGGGNLLTRAAQQATNTIPIVMTNVLDPVGSGFIASLARPGGNITGLTAISSDLAGKRLELIKETLPKASRIAVLLDPGDPSKIVELKEVQAAANVLGIRLHSIEVRSPAGFESAFKAGMREHVEAVFVLQSAVTNTHRRTIAELATKNRFPTMWGEPGLLDAGGLMSYGPNYTDLFRRAATYVDKILKGAKPADLPVEQPAKFELAINLKTAKQIGVTIPPSVLARADRVIK